MFDAGSIILSKKVDIEEQETYQEVSNKLSMVCAEHI
jgi:methionyl-tRNA formyltransferase